MTCVNALTIILSLSSKQTHRHTRDAVELMRKIQAHTSSLGSCRVRGVAALDALTALINIVCLLILKFRSLTKSRRADISKVNKVVRSLALAISASLKFGSNLFESNLCWIQTRVRVLVEFGVYSIPTRSNGL